MAAMPVALATILVFAVCVSLGVNIMSTVATSRLSASVAALAVSVSTAIEKVTTAQPNNDAEINAAADQLDGPRAQIDLALTSVTAPEGAVAEVVQTEGTSATN